MEHMEQDREKIRLRHTDFLDEAERIMASIQENESGLEEDISDTPLKEENEKILKSLNYTQLYNSILLDVHDLEKSLFVVQENFTETLLKRGIKINPQEAYSTLELINSRMVRLFIAKRLALAFGFHAELDSIMEKEMNLIYGSPTANRKSNIQTTVISNEVT